MINQMIKQKCNQSMDEQKETFIVPCINRNDGEQSCRNTLDNKDVFDKESSEAINDRMVPRTSNQSMDETIEIVIVPKTIRNDDRQGQSQNEFDEDFIDESKTMSVFNKSLIAFAIACIVCITKFYFSQSMDQTIGRNLKSGEIKFPQQRFKDIQHGKEMYDNTTPGTNVTWTAKVLDDGRKILVQGGTPWCYELRPDADGTTAIFCDLIDVYLVERFIMLRGVYGVWHSGILFQKSGDGAHPASGEKVKTPAPTGSSNAPTGTSKAPTAKWTNAKPTTAKPTTAKTTASGKVLTAKPKSKAPTASGKVLTAKPKSKAPTASGKVLTAKPKSKAPTASGKVQTSAPTGSSNAPTGSSNAPTTQPELSWKYSQRVDGTAMARWKHQATPEHDHLRTPIDNETFLEGISDQTKYSNVYMSYGTRGARSKMTLNWKETGTVRKEKIGQMTAGYDLKTIMQKIDIWIRRAVPREGDDPDDPVKMDRMFLNYHLFKANCYKWCQHLTKMLKDAGMLDEEMGNRFQQYDDVHTFAMRAGTVGGTAATSLAGSLVLLCAVALAAGLIYAAYRK